MLLGEKFCVFNANIKSNERGRKLYGKHKTFCVEILHVVPGTFLLFGKLGNRIYEKRSFSLCGNRVGGTCQTVFFALIFFYLGYYVELN